MHSINIMKFLSDDYLYNDLLIDRSSAYEPLEKYLYSQYSLFEGAQVLDLHCIGFMRASYIGALSNLKKIAKFNSIDSNVDNFQDFILTEYQLNQKLSYQKSPDYHIDNIFMFANDFLTDLKNSNTNQIVNISSESNQYSQSTRSDIKFLAMILYALVNQSSQISLEFSNSNKLKLIVRTGDKFVELNYLNEFDQISDHNNKKFIESLEYLIQNKHHSQKCIITNVAIFKALIVEYLKSFNEITSFYKYLNCCLIDYFDLPESKAQIDPVTKELLNYLELVDKFKKSTPYTNVGRLEYTMMPFYMGNGIFDHRQSFSTCVESSLFHLCNFLLWDADTQKYIKPYLNDSQNEPNAFKMFKGKMKGSHTRSELAVWHTYIQNLGNSLLIDADTPLLDEIELSLFLDPVSPNIDEMQAKLNPFNHVFYVKSLGSVYNELKSGLISFLKNLEYLTNMHGLLTSDLKELLAKHNWQIGEDFDWTSINVILKEAFLKIIGECYRDRIKVEFKNGRYELIGQKYEIFGRFTVKRKFEKSLVEHATIDIDITDRCHTQPNLDDIKFRHSSVIEDKFSNYINGLQKDDKNYSFHNLIYHNILQKFNGIRRFEIFRML